MLSDYLTLETKKLYAASQIAQVEALDIINEYLSTFSFSSGPAKKLATNALLKLRRSGTVDELSTVS